MPVKVLRYEPTPNPNAIKCILSAKVADTSRSFRTAEAAAGEGGDPIASTLFTVTGVTGVLLLNDWITVNKRPDATWPPIKKALEKALAAHTG